MHRVGDPFLDDLAEALVAADSRIDSFADEVFQLTGELVAGRHKPDTATDVLARRYFLLYAVPVIDAAHVLDGRSDTAALQIAAHLCFGLHIRFCDYVLDGDGQETLRSTALALAYATHAIALLARSGVPPGREIAAVLLQYFDYEEEALRGYNHDASSLWRRVSPLCVVPETVLRRFPAREAYRRFLSWSLVAADCDDFLEDLRANRATPVTRALRRHVTGSAADAQAIAATVAQIREHLASEAVEIRHTLRSRRWRLWETVLTRLAGALNISYET